MPQRCRAIFHTTAFHAYMIRVLVLRAVRVHAPSDREVFRAVMCCLIDARYAYALRVSCCRLTSNPVLQRAVACEEIIAP